MESKYGIIYIQVSLPKSHGMSWLRWCNSPNLLPEAVRNELFEVIRGLNNKWREEMVIPLDESPLTTCLTKPGRTLEIAEDVYDKFNAFIAKYSQVEDNLRIVWTEAELPVSVEERPSAHMLGNFPGPIRVGRFLEEGEEVGIFEV